MKKFSNNCFVFVVVFITTLCAFIYFFTEESVQEVKIALDMGSPATESQVYKWKQFLNKSANLILPTHIQHRDKNFAQSLAKLQINIKKTIENIINEFDQHKHGIKQESRMELRHLVGEAVNAYEHEMANIKSEIMKLQRKVTKNLMQRQNPPDCKNARRLICQIENWCGLGCQMHYIGACLMHAYGSDRAMLLQPDKFFYFAKWETVLKPVSSTCTLTKDDNPVDVGDPRADDALVVSMPTDESHKPISLFAPGTVPESLAPSLFALHGDPVAWWHGQFMAYVVRPQQSVEQEINNFMEKFEFNRPIVGMQVRRTDKIVENYYVGLQEYMEKAEEWFLQYEITHKVSGIERRVFLATDDASVKEEAITRYPHYEIIYNENAVYGYFHRFWEKGYRSVVVDVHLLAYCDYLVCTMSSNVCRLAYEILQTHQTDGSTSFYSLDSPYIYYWEYPRRRIAIRNHTSTNQEEIILSAGDVIFRSYDYWNGYEGFGTNERTGKSGIYPTYKTRPIIPLANYKFED